MTRTLTASAALVATLALTAPADAAPRNDRGHHVALSLSPIHLLLPVVEVQGEYLFHDSFSAALILGYGKVDATVTRTYSNGAVDKETITFDVFELGAQFRGYFWGGSEGGAYAGAEVVYLQVDGELDDVVGVAAGTTIGPFVGYKWTWDNFFIDLNGGVQFLAVAAEAEDQSSGERDGEESSEVGPLLNFNLGWSF